MHINMKRELGDFIKKLKWQNIAYILINLIIKNQDFIARLFIISVAKVYNIIKKKVILIIRCLKKGLAIINGYIFTLAVFNIFKKLTCL